jgi:hypothetical protein
LGGWRFSTRRTRDEACPGLSDVQPLRDWPIFTLQNVQTPESAYSLSWRAKRQAAGHPDNPEACWDSASPTLTLLLRDGWSPRWWQAGRLPYTDRSRFPDSGDHDRAPARFDVALQMEDLLPGAQYDLAIFNGHGERWPEHGSLQVRVAVAVVPGLLVTVVAARRKQPKSHWFWTATARTE